MNTLKSWALLIAVALPTVCLVQAQEVGIVKKNRVNVRGQASQSSEVITQLQQGEAVVILQEVENRKAKRGEPVKWAKIQLPPNTPVWVFAPYVDAANKTVNSRRLNIRGGPGENFSVLGRLDRGATVKEIRTVESWMEIVAPTNAYAFVALDLIEKQAPTAPPIAVAPAPEPAPVPPPTTVQTVTPEPAPAQPSEPVVTTPAPEPATPVPQPAITAEPVAPTPVEPEEAPRRVVAREGIVIVSRSIQAPTSYGLEGLETKRTINYLHSEDPAIKFKLFAGRKVIVTGEELLDQRWARTPIIEVESIRLSP